MKPAAHDSAPPPDALAGEIWVEANGERMDGPDCEVPLAVMLAMMGKRSKVPVQSPRLFGNVEAIQDTYMQWTPGMRRVEFYPSSNLHIQQRSPGVSSFFSGGADSLHSLIVHRDEITHLVMVHGFDMFLEDQASFDAALAPAREVAEIYGKKLVVVRTNLRDEPHRVNWTMGHGPALGYIALALQPIHRKVFIASTYAAWQLHRYGSHAMVDPLWSTEAVEVVHDGVYSDRVGKLRVVAREPEALKRLRVCWQNTGSYNCGECEKCVRTMVALKGIGALDSAPFPTKTIDPALVRRAGAGGSVEFWSDLVSPDVALPAELSAAVRAVLRDLEYGLPPHGTLREEARRLRAGARKTLDVWRTAFR